MSNTVTAQLISDDLPGFRAMSLQYTSEETGCCFAISSFLQIDIDYFTILINRDAQSARQR
jgi:hypothetical protein